MDPMMKMWVSFVGIGLMVLAAVVVMFARAKTKGFIRFLLSFIAFACLLTGMLCGFIAII